MMNALQVAFLGGLALLSFVTIEWTPYYPIEVSRMLAQSSVATGLFAFIVSVPLVVGHVVPTTGALVSVAGVAVIVVASDVDYYVAHMLGVGVIGVGVLMKALETNNVALVPLAAVIWTLRIVFKLVTVWLFEEAETVWDIPSRAQSIMLHGNPKSAWTLAAFKLGGFGQWLVFWIATSMY
jgi:hypothetical protein